MGAVITGGCLCGACRYSSNAEPVDVRACHCRICQKATGAPLYARIRVPFTTVSMEGPVGWYDSSDIISRGFCTRCGTSLYSRRRDGTSIALTFGSLDHPDRYAPTMHVWTSSRQKWLILADDLPCFELGPPA